MFFSDEQLQEALREFKDESLELLAAMEEALLAIQDGGNVNEHINAVFRAAHTIKGSAGMLKLEYVVKFTHVTENLLDEVRNGHIVLTEPMIDVLLQCKDHMQQLVLVFGDGNKKEIDSDLETISAMLIDSLKNFLGTSTGDESQSQGVKPVELRSPTHKKWHIDIKFADNVFEFGMDPNSFIRYLSKLGSVESVVTHMADVPRLLEINPVKCYLSYSIVLLTDKSESEIHDVFEFVKDDSEISIFTTDSEDCEYEDEHSDTDDSGSQKQQSTLKDGASETATTIVTSSTLRVDSDRIDVLINLIGEMVIANANVIQRASELNDSDLVESVSVVSRMLEEIRESTMKIRMVQIGETFNKFKRIVHDVSKKLGKDVELVINGGETEMDKTIVEKISDPLIHIVRNAMDHGLENTEERVAKGKNPKGKLELNAYHDAGTIAIEIVEDGRGLNEERILKKAIERGIIDENANLSQKEIFNLIFEPGFSTADQVTDISGRGVGMDVVRRNIEMLRGSVDIKSAKDKGSTFTIRLPLTLAIIDGFLVRVGQAFYVVPLEMVVECIELNKRFKEEMHGNNYINLRGTILPLLNARRFFKVDDPKTSERDNILVIQYAGQKFGIIVEELHGEFQTVIKPLGKIFRELKGISGSTILGSGEVALILDVPVLMNHINAIVNHYERGGADEVKSA